jgi:hypothetical protein
MPTTRRELLESLLLVPVAAVAARLAPTPPPVEPEPELPRYYRMRCVNAEGGTSRYVLEGAQTPDGPWLIVKNRGRF